MIVDIEPQSGSDIASNEVLQFKATIAQLENDNSILKKQVADLIVQIEKS